MEFSYSIMKQNSKTIKLFYIKQIFGITDLVIPYEKSLNNLRLTQESKRYKVNFFNCIWVLEGHPINKLKNVNSIPYNFYEKNYKNKQEVDLSQQIFTQNYISKIKERKVYFFHLIFPTHFLLYALLYFILHHWLISSSSLILQLIKVGFSGHAFQRDSVLFSYFVPSLKVCKLSFESSCT